MKKEPTLSTREFEVLQLLAEGKQTKEIAAILFLSPKTIGHYRTTLMGKLDIHSAVGLTRYAIARGIVEVPK